MSIINAIKDMTNFGALVKTVDHITPTNSVVREVSISETSSSEPDYDMDALKRVIMQRMGGGDSLSGFEFVKIEDVTNKGDFPDAIF